MRFTIYYETRVLREVTVDAASEEEARQLVRDGKVGGEIDDVEWLIAELRASQAECAKLEGIYASAVNGRAEMRTALKEERAKRPLGITEWSTVENVERVIAERDALKAKLAEAVAHLEAAVSGDWYPHKTAAFLASLKVAP